MFYHFIYPLHEYYTFLNVFQYITVRSGAAFLTALFFSLIVGNKFVHYMRSIQGMGQPIRKEGPESHYAKAGTPTMGGILILGALFISSFLWGNFSSHYVIIFLIVTFGFGAIGFLDDFLKVKYANTDGFPGRVRLLIGVIISLCASYWIYMLSPQDIAGALTFPFSNEYSLYLGLVLLPFWVFVIVGTANAVNLTDGLDGLVSGPVFIAAGAFAIITYVTGHIEFAQYLQIHYVPNSGELTVLLAALMGACLGFLWFNASPAMIFMGDTGSLALGGALGVTSIVTRHEFVLVIIGGVFVMETVSVILQVAGFKMTGKRIFRMAPLHHHFEKKGWPETRVVMRFWIVAIVFALVGLASLKIR